MNGGNECRWIVDTMKQYRLRNIGKESNFTFNEDYAIIITILKRWKERDYKVKQMKQEEDKRV